MDFTPNEIGDHKIRFYGDEEKNLMVTQFVCQVYDSSRISVSDLPFGVIHQVAKFTGNVNFNYLRTL